MRKTFLLYGIIAAALALTGFFLLPVGGSFLYRFNTGIKVFLKNLYLSQELGSQNQLLREENQKLLSDLAELMDVRQENDFLREQLSFQKASKKRNLLLSSVIGQGSAFGQEVLIVDKGTSDGIKGGEAVVLNPNILIGKVHEVFDNYAIVALLFHREFKITAQTTSGVPGIIKGDASRRILFDEVSQAAVLNANDIVITDNRTPFIPSNLVIGKVKAITSQPTDIYKNAQVELAVDVDTVERAFIIIPEM